MPDNERQQPVDREELEEAVTEVEEVGSADDGEAEPEGNAEEQQDRSEEHTSELQSQ